MASKVCPVCKTYSSSSNTALNVHIDQCLSGESTMKCTANPKVNVNDHSIKPRIKPRKTRLLSDIYKTALPCTVEELDARNGRTRWANISSFSDQELEFQDEEKDATNIVPAVSDHEGDVYIDNNGTKVRILSVPKVDTSNGHRARKLLKRGKSSEIFIRRKKMEHLKLSPSDKKLCSRNPSKVKTAREKNDRVKEVLNRDDSPIVRPPWACSKRTVLAKKLRANLRIPPPLRKTTSSDSRLTKRSNITISCMVSEENMSDSPISTISNPVLARSDSEKFSVRSTTSLKDDISDFSDAINDKYAPIASKKHGIETFNKPPMKLAAYNECDSVRSPSKPVLRLMGKNLTVVNTNDQEFNYGQFPNGVNEQKFASNHTVFGNTVYVDCFGKPHVGPMIPQDRAHEDRNNTYADQELSYGQFPNVLNEEKFPSNHTLFGNTTYADCFGNPHVGPMISPNRAHEDRDSQFPNVLNEQKIPSNHTVYGNTVYDGCFGKPHVGPMISQDRAHEDRNRYDDQILIKETNMTSNSIDEPIIIDDIDYPENEHAYTPLGYQPQSSMAFGNGGFQACFPFGKWYRTPTTGSSRSSAI